MDNSRAVRSNNFSSQVFGINFFVRVTRFELAHSKRTPAPQAGASTNSAIRALL